MNHDAIEEMIERYIYDVVRRLPQHQRDDIRRELRSLIDDMMEARAGDCPTESDLNQVLQQLGEPKKMADQYRDKKRYLIGPAYFDQYVTVLKIVLPCVLLGMAIVGLLNIGLVGSSNHVFAVSDYVSAVSKITASMVEGLVQGFVWVTVIFALIEYNSDKAPVKAANPKVWSPSDLPQVPSEKAMIPIREPISGIIFTVLVIILFNFAPQLMGVYVIRGGLSTSIPIFDLNVLGAMLPLFDVCFALGAVREVSKLILGRYSLKLALIALATNVVTIVLTLLIFSNGAIWNPNFLKSLIAVKMLPTPENINMPLLWSNMGYLFIAIVVFATVLDSAVLLYKGWKAEQN